VLPERGKRKRRLGEGGGERDWVVSSARWEGVVGIFEGKGVQMSAGAGEAGWGGGLAGQIRAGTARVSNFSRTWGLYIEEERKKERQPVRGRIMTHLRAALDAADASGPRGYGGGRRRGGIGLSTTLLGEREWGDVDVLGARGVCLRRLGQLEEECAAGVCVRARARTRGY